MADIRDYDNIYEYAEAQEEENEQFYGTDLDETKAERLREMQKICIELADLDSGIKNEFFVFDNTCMNASVQVRFPSIFFSPDKRIASLLSDLYGKADYVWMSSASGDILLTFSIADMWKKHGKRSEKNN